MTTITLTFLAHSLIGLYFVFSAFWNVYHWRHLADALVKTGIPSTVFILGAAITLEGFAGFMLMFGLYTKIVAMFLIPFTIIAVLIFHPFWHFLGDTRRLNFALFVNYLTISLGALLLLVTL